MALVVKDRVKETTTTTGTGTVTLAGAATGYQSFSAIGNANTTYYTISSPGVNEWEVGIGTYTSSGTTLSRDTILASSNSGSAVNFSAGTKDVYVVYPAGKAIYLDASGNSVALGTPASTTTLTNCTGLPISTGVSGLGTGVATFLATPSSANLASAVTDETGSGLLVFGTSPTMSNITLSAGTASLAPVVMTSGTNLSSAAAGAIEYDGVAFYTTGNTTSGRGFTPTTQYFRLTSDGSAITTIANFFGATSGSTLVANAFYEFEAVVYLLKTTAGTVTFTMTFSNAPVNNNAYYVGTPITGVGTQGTAQSAGLVKSTATAGALPATGSLSNGVNHQFTIRAMFQANATTGGTLNLQLTSTATNATPLTGSYYKLTRLPAANTGAFA
jgi:hypothetical protein